VGVAVGALVGLAVGAGDIPFQVYAVGVSPIAMLTTTAERRNLKINMLLELLLG
jgi:hypothetical protein